MWLRRYRLLIVVYGIALVVGTREYLAARAGRTLAGVGGCEASAASCFSIRARVAPVSDSVFWSRHAGLSQVLTAVNPGDPDTDFFNAMQALADGDGEEFTRLVERVLDAGVKHNHLLLQYYAQTLLDRGADWRVVNEAVNRWRENHPFSADRLSLRLSAGPRNSLEEIELRRALEQVGWIGNAQLETYGEGGEQRWRVAVAFRPGREIDVRQAVAAATILSIPAAQRPFYEVTCQTLEECTATRR